MPFDFILHAVLYSFAFGLLVLAAIGLVLIRSDFGRKPHE